jgi:hypothetical protein
MTFKVLLVFSSKKSISRLYQIASVEHSKQMIQKSSKQQYYSLMGMDSMTCFRKVLCC